MRGNCFILSCFRDPNTELFFWSNLTSHVFLSSLFDCIYMKVNEILQIVLVLPVIEEVN